VKKFSGGLLVGGRNAAAFQMTVIFAALALDHARRAATLPEQLAWFDL
jgi:hypothetical protein